MDGEYEKRRHGLTKGRQGYPHSEETPHEGKVPTLHAVQILDFYPLEKKSVLRFKLASLWQFSIKTLENKYGVSLGS